MAENKPQQKKKAKKLTALVRDLEKSLDFNGGTCPWLSQNTTKSMTGGPQCTCAML